MSWYSISTINASLYLDVYNSRAAVVHFNFRAGSNFPVPVCTVSPGLWVNKADRTSRCNKVNAVRLDASYRLNLLLLKGPRCVNYVLYCGVKVVGHVEVNY